MTTIFQGQSLVPGILADQEIFENQFWFGETWQQVWGQGVILGSALDAGNTGQTTTLRAGLLLGKVTASNKLKEWSPTATDGSQIIYGVLSQTINTQRLNADTDRLVGRLWLGGLVKEDRLINPGTATISIVGTAQEWAIKDQLAHRAQFSIDNTTPGAGGFNNIVAKTTDYTVLEADTGTRFTTRGAAGDVNFTLPATAELGLHYWFYSLTDNEMMVTSGTADTLVTFNDAAADTVAYTTASEQIGGCFEVIGDGTSWLVVSNIAAEAQTITVTT